MPLMAYGPVVPVSMTMMKGNLAAGGPDPLASFRVVTGPLAQHVLGVLARRRGPGGHGQVRASDLHGIAQHVGIDLLLRKPAEALPELRVLEDRLRRVHRCDRGVV